MACSADGIIYFPYRSGVSAINPDGSSKWNCSFGDTFFRGSIAVQDDGNLAATAGNKLFSISSNGVVRWQLSFSQNIDHSLALGTNGVVYVACRDNKFYAIDSSGIIKWSFQTDKALVANSLQSGPVVGQDGTIYFGAEDGKLYALNPDGTKKWDYFVGVAIRMPAAIGQDGTIYVAGLDGVLSAFSPAGVKKWQFSGQSGGEMRWPPSIGSDGTIYYPCGNYVYWIDSFGTKLRQYFDYLIWTTPTVLSDGSFYVTGSNRLLEHVNADATLRRVQDAVYPINYPPMVKPDGSVIFALDNVAVYSLNGGLATAGSVWPMFQRDLRRTGRTPAQPVLDWVTPGTSTNFVVGQSVPLRVQPVNLSPTDRADYFINGTLVASSSVLPFTGSWTAVGPTTATLTAIAYSGSLSVTSKPIVLNILSSRPNSPPVTVVSDPTNHTGWVAGQSVAVFSAASDVDGIVEKVEFYDGDVFLGIQAYPDFRQPIPAISPGLHQFKSVAIDNFGARATSGVVNAFAVNKLWEISAPDTAARFKSPATGSNGVVYAVAKQALYALNPNGTALWSYPLDNAYATSAPSVASDGTIYFGDNTGTIHAVNSAGASKWKVNLTGITLNPPVVDHEGNIFISTDRGNLYSLDSLGQLRWLTNGNSANISIAEDGTIYCGAFGFRALNKDGSEKWKFDLTGRVSAPPTIGPDRTVYFGADGVGQFYALNPSGSVQWSIPIASSGVSTASAAIDSNRNVYFGTRSGSLYSVTSAGVVNWSLALGAEILTTPMITSDGTLFVPCGSKLFAISAGGVVLWSYGLPANATESCGITLAGNILLPVDNNRLYAIENTQGLMGSAWPMFQQNPQHTGVALDGPQIVLTSPTADAQFESGSIVPLAVNVVDKAADIVKVDYFSGSTLLLTSTSPPYSVNWQSVAGIHQLKALATDQNGAINSSDVVRIKVVPPGTAPSVLASPTNFVTGVGSNVVLFADVMGSPPLTFQWLKDGITISGANSTTLLLTNVSAANSARYELRVSNAFGTNTTSKALVSVLETPRVRWLSTAFGVVSSTPAGGADGRLYFSTSSRALYAFNTLPLLEWTYTKGISAGDGASLLSSPAVGLDGTVYIGTQSGRSLAVNQDGTEQWTVYPGGPVDSSPAIGSDGMIYYGNRAMYPDGTARWQLSLSGAVLTSSAAIGADGTIYICSYGDAASANKGKLYALNPTGTIKWQFLAGSNVVTSPAIGAKGEIYFGSLDRKMYSINTNGVKLWEFLTDGPIQSSAAIGSDGRIYFGNNNAAGHLYCLDSAGNLIWSFDARRPIHTSPAIAQDGTVYFGSSDQSIYALNPNGTEKWEFPTGNAIEVSPTIGVDGTIYCPSSDGTLYALLGGKPPANSSWPMFRHDWRHTGNVSNPQEPEPRLPLVASYFNDQVVASSMVGSNVYIGGTFTLAGGIAANSVARWDGVNWHALDKGITGVVSVMTSIGTNLYVAGTFTNAGSIPAVNVARWDGYQWYPMNTNTNDDIRALGSLDGVLYAAGYFYFNGQAGISTVAKWNGNQWVPFGTPLYSTLSSIAFLGTNLYVGGFGNLGTSAAPLNYVARWNGSAWQNLGTGMNDYVYSMTAFGGDLYVGGRFTTANGVLVNNIARWNGISWTALGSGLSYGASGPVPNVLCLVTNGSQLYLGGFFSSAGGIPANNIASWDGTDFRPLSQGILGKNFNRSVPIVNSISVLNSRIFVGGSFLAGGGNTSIRFFGMFDGNNWNALESRSGFMDGSFRLLLPLGRGPGYGIEASSDLTNWIRISGSTNFTDSLIFSDSQSSTQKQRFYRTVSP